MGDHFRGLSRGRKEREILISWPRCHQQNHSCYVTKEEKGQQNGTWVQFLLAGTQALTLQLEIRKTRTLACTQWVLPISTKMPACMGSFLWEHCSLYSQGLTSGANQRTFLNKFCYIESMNEKWFVLNVITIQLHLDAKYRFSNVILNWTYYNVLSPFQQIFNTKT